jgi:aminoglycoside 6-adenylyltransferase
MRSKQVQVDPAIIEQLVGWAERHSDLHAMLLYSSRVDPAGIVDRFSDYDVISIVDDVRPYHADDRWLQEVGDTMVVFRSPIEFEHGFESFGFVTHYHNGMKIDFGFYPVAFVEWIKSRGHVPDYLDRGYVVLIDKDHTTDGLPAPTYSAYIPRPPTQLEFGQIIEEFFNDAAYVAKNLWRDNLFGAKLSLDHIMKHQCLRRMLEWQSQIHYHWKANIGSHGKRLKGYVKSELWSRLEATYVGFGHEENWEALFTTVDLFREVAIDISRELGLEYLMETDRRVVEHLNAVRQLGRGATATSG